MTFMKRALVVLAFGVAAVGAVGTVTVSAHHSFAMFDMEKNVTYLGTVTAWNWQNPHVHFTVLVKPGQNVTPDTIGTWDVEGGSVNIMTRQGWTRATYKPGDQITVVGHPMRDGSKGISLFYAIRPDGTRLYHDIARPGASDTKP
jgi:hypothetical protein